MYLYIPLQVFGANGMLQCKNPPTDDVAIMTEPATMISPAIHAFSQRYEQAYLLEFDHFLDVVCDPERSMIVQKRDALRAAQLADACQMSYRIGQVVPFQYKDL